MSDIHSVSFLTKDYIWSTVEARAWLKKHNLVPIKKVHKIKVDNEITQLRYRIKDPALFKRFSTKYIKKDGINLILGYY